MTLPVQELCAGLPFAIPLLPSHSYPLSGDVTNFATCPGGFFVSALPTVPAAGSPLALPLPFPLPDGRPVPFGSYGPGWLAPAGTGSPRIAVTEVVVAVVLNWNTPPPTAIPVATNSHVSPGSRTPGSATSPDTYIGWKSSLGSFGVALSSVIAPRKRPMLPGFVTR